MRRRFQRGRHRATKNSLRVHTLVRESQLVSIETVFADLDRIWDERARAATGEASHA